MRIVTGVKIKGMRSIQNEALTEIGSLTVLVGKNSSGKSNFLRALNLFFNDEIEPGKRLLLQRDFHNRPQARRKKEIEVSIDFELPSTFNFRPGLAGLKNALGNSFTIAKRWELSAQKETEVHITVRVGDQDLPNGDTLARQLLALITFRYIPNRTVPAALLREESRVISGSIVSRIRGESGAQALMAAMRTAADGLLRRASTSMVKAGAPLSEVAIASATSLAEMLSVTGFQARGVNGNVVRDEEWGAGSQAFFLYEVLQAVDTNFSRGFGWKQFTIWGVEEPESGLHRDLESCLADELRTWASDERSKLQIIQTTHSAIFAMAADTGFWIELDGGASTAKRTPIPDLVRDAERKGVSGWVQPVLAFPSNPVVLVEGDHDVDVLTHVSTLMGLGRMRFLSLPTLDTAERAGGKDAIVTYLKRHAGLLGNRPKEYPLVVILDWEVSNQELQQARQAYGVDGVTAVIRANHTYCAADLGTDFKGLERFYPPDAVRAAAAANECLIADVAGHPISISAPQLARAKHALKTRVLAIQPLAQLDSLVKVIRDIEVAIGVLARRP